MLKSIKLLLVGMIASLAVPAFLHVSNIKEANASVGNYSTDAATYYNGITATSGKQLAGQLHDLITSTHQSYTSYDDNGTNGYQKYTDQYYENGSAVSGYIYEFYSGVKWPNGWYPYSKDTRGGYNREHCWCQSNSKNADGKQMWGKDGGGADMHHLRPVETDLNSTRGNHPYGEVSGDRDSHKIYARLGGTTSYHGGYYYDDVYEPLDSKKGDVARILFYTYLHYNSYGVSDVFGGYAYTNGSGSSDYFSTSLLSLTKITSQSTEANALSMLLRWNTADPVDEIEQRRNEQVAIYQGNRNPFIDNSSYADMIWGTAIGITSISKTSVTLTTSGSTTVSAVSSNGGNITWTSSNPSVVTVSPGTASSGSNVTINAVAAGTATITASITISGTTYSKICSVKVNEPRTLSSITLQDKKTEYNVGDEFIMPTVIANYSNSSTEDVSNLATQSGFDSSTAGEKEITISYTEGLLTKTATYTITVSESSGATGAINFGNATGSTSIDAVSVKGDDSLENEWTITTTFSKNNYFGQSSTYSQIGSSNNPAVTITFTTTLSDSADFDITSFSAKFGGFSDTAGTVTLKVGDTTIGTGSLNGTNDVVIENSSTAEGRVLTVTVTGISKGVKAYYISYSYGTGPVELESISLDTENVQTGFTVNDPFDYSGLIVTANYSDGTHETLDSFDVSEPDMSTTGTKTVTVSYTYDEVTKEASYEITVSNAVTLVSITVSNPKTSYNTGDTFVKPTVTATYSDESHADVTDDADFSGYDLTTAGDYTVTVSYTEGSITEETTYDIKVTASSTTTVTLSVAKYATDNNWENDTKYSSMIINSIITATASTGGNTGRYISDGNTWRFYQTSNSTLQISAAEGYVIDSIELTFSTSSNGVLKNGDDTLVSETAYAVNASSITLSVGNSGTGTNGQVRFTNFSITYHSSSTPPVIESISAVANKNFAVGDVITTSDITVTANTGAEITDYTFADENYQFKYSDAASGGALTEKTFTDTITYGDLHCDLTVNVSRTAYVAPSTSNVDYSATNFKTAGVSTKRTEATNGDLNVNGMSMHFTDSYIYTKNSTNYLSFTLVETVCTGSIQNNAAYPRGIKNIDITQTGDDLDIQLSVDGLNNWVDLADAEENTNYYYFNIYRKNQTTTTWINISNIRVVLKGEETPANLANYIMFTDTNGQCEDKFSYAESYFQNLSSEGKITFMTSTDYVLSTASERFRNWASHQGKQIVLEDSVWVIKDVKATPLFGNIENGNETALVAIVAILSGCIVLSYFFLKKRKYN